MAADSWTWKNELAEAKLDDAVLRMSLAKPTDGLNYVPTLGGVWSFFQCQPIPEHKLQIEEAYVRQRDMIVRFGQSQGDQFGFQLNYRLLELDPRFVFGLEFWISIQTDHLDVEPKTQITCHSPAGASWNSMTHGRVLDLDESAPDAHSSPAALIAGDSNHSVAWLIEFSDQQHAELISLEEDQRQSVELFGQFMEKGVIRRARMRVYVIHGEVRRECLKDLYTEFAKSPLPLTA